MRQRGYGSFFFSNNATCLRGRKRQTGQSLCYPRVMMRALVQVLTEEYSEYGVHIAKIVIAGSRWLARDARPAAGAAATGYIDESCQDRGGLLLPPDPREVLLDARAPIDALYDQAHLNRSRELF